MTTQAKQAKILHAITLGAVIFFALVTIAIVVMGHLLPRFDMAEFNHSIAVAKDPSTKLQILREIIPNIEIIVHGMWQMAQGELSMLYGLSSIATIWFLIIYIWVRRSTLSSPK